MKTKLLKKVRRKCRIIKVLRVSDPSHWLWCYKHRVPFWIVEKRDNNYTPFVTFSRNDAYKRLKICAKEIYERRDSKLIEIEEIW